MPENENRPSDEEPRTYRLDISDAAELEADEIYLRISQQSPDRARDWYVGLLNAYDRLLLFPYGYVALPDQPGVRRMLYGKYRVTYRVVEPEEDETEGVVRILHIYHGA